MEQLRESSQPIAAVRDAIEVFENQDDFVELLAVTGSKCSDCEMRGARFGKGGRVEGGEVVMAGGVSSDKSSWRRRGAPGARWRLDLRSQWHLSGDRHLSVAVRGVGPVGSAYRCWRVSKGSH